MTRGTRPEATPAPAEEEGALKRRFSRRMALASVSMAAEEGGDLRRCGLSRRRLCLLAAVNGKLRPLGRN